SPLAQLLAVIAMSQHKTGKPEAAAETLKRLDAVLKNPPASTDPQAVALSQEARTVLAAPLDGPWNEQAAWESCKRRLEKLPLDAAKLAIWQAWSSVRLAGRYAARGEVERAAAARVEARILLEAELPKASQDLANVAALADLLLKDPAIAPDAQAA